MGKRSKIKKLRRKFQEEHGRDPMKAGLFVWRGVMDWQERVRWTIANVLLNDRIKLAVRTRQQMGMVDHCRFYLSARIIGKKLMAKIKEHRPTPAEDEFRKYKKKHI